MKKGGPDGAAVLKFRAVRALSAFAEHALEDRIDMLGVIRSSGVEVLIPSLNAALIAV